MDTNLEDRLNLESDMGVEFEEEQDAIVHQDDMTLQQSGDESLPMEFEHIEDQPMLMETSSEEIIVSDFMGDQFTLQEYQTQDDVTINLNPKAEPIEEHVFSSDGENMIDVQFEQPITVQASGLLASEPVLPHPRIVSVQSVVPPMRPIAPKKQTVVVTKAIAPKQVAIAPKPPKLVTGLKMTQLGKQYTLAPKPTGGNVKPVTIVTNKAGQVVKKISIPTTQDPTTGNAVLAIGKQLVMLPPGGGQKIKLVASGTNAPSVRLISADKSQLITPQNLTGQQNPKQMMTKVVVQGSKCGEQPGGAMVTKIVGGGGAPRYVMHSNSGPLSLANAKFTNVVIGSPTKTGIRYTQAKKQIALNTPPNKIGGVKKIVVSANPAAPAVPVSQAHSPTREMVKVAPKPPTGQKTELHQINVPGKGVQYIRLVTNVAQARQVINAANSRTTPRMIVTDFKVAGNRIASSQPPPLIVTSGAAAPATEPKQSPNKPKLVKIAPVWSKHAQGAMNRGGKSLLAPLSPVTPTESQPTESQPTAGDPLDVREEEVHTSAEEAAVDGDDSSDEAVDSKSALRQLIADTIGSDSSPQRQSAQYDNQQSQGSDHPLIVIPSYMKQDLSEVYDNSYSNNNDDSSPHSVNQEESKYGQPNFVKIAVDPFNSFQPPSPSEGSGGLGGELVARPRRACNCTKSACLKLYCDCFAAGEFCHRCNCTNCHNNLENEQLRQKAIKGCLDRNPNAFRPKIGKAKEDTFVRHNKGCNCKRSGCLKNYCECYEAKIACTSICRCVGCRNVEESMERTRRREARLPAPAHPRPPAPKLEPREPVKQPCSFMTSEVIEAVCQCLIAASVESPNQSDGQAERDPLADVIDEFARCLQDIISASHQATPAPLNMFDEAQI